MYLNSRENITQNQYQFKKCSDADDLNNLIGSGCIMLKKRELKRVDIVCSCWHRDVDFMENQADRFPNYCK